MNTWYNVTVKSQSYCTSTLIASKLDSNTLNHLSLAYFSLLNWSVLILHHMELIEAFSKCSVISCQRSLPTG